MTRRVRIILLASLIWAICFGVGYFNTPRTMVLPPTWSRG